MMVMMNDDHDDNDGDECHDHDDDASIRMHKVEVKLLVSEESDFIPTFSVAGKDWSTCPHVCV